MPLAHFKTPLSKYSSVFSWLSRLEAASFNHGVAQSKLRCTRIRPLRTGMCCMLQSQVQMHTPNARKHLRRGPNKTTQLEGKLDNLVTLLLKTRATSSTPSSEPCNTLDEPLNNQLHTQATQDTSPGGGNKPMLAGYFEGWLPRADVATEPRRQSVTATGYATPTSISPAHCLEPPSLQDDECLKVFRDCHLQTLPFIYLPPDVTVAHLKRERPFLWLNIRALCCKSTSEKKRLDRQIRSILGQRLLVDLDRNNIDLLLGLLAYLAWTLDHLGSKKILCTYAGLATSLVFDLRLDRPGQESPCRETNACKSFSHPIKQYIPSTYRTNEERRAILACFTTCSNISSFIRSQPMRWMPHMEACLQHLANEPETPGDELLVNIVKISRIVDDANLVASGRLFAAETGNLPKTPPMLHVKALLANLETIEKELPPWLVGNRVIRSYMCDTTTMINDLPLFCGHFRLSVPGWVDFGRTECLYGCLNAIKAGLDNWFSFTPNELFGSSMGIPLHFGRFTHILYRLAISEDPAWDRNVVRSAVDLVTTLERAADLFGSVPEALGLQTDGSDPFNKGATTLRLAAPMWKRAFVELDAAAENVRLGSQGGIGEGALGGVSGDFVPMDFSDDAWLTDMFTSWEAV
ncbi:hypothetical protein G7046_g1896 [Stylonectria norvegica]|nr:hypothetical protein G7046_g1896 [Stylonectria norvegica]